MADTRRDGVMSMQERTCLTVIAGFHDFSSSRIDRQTVPEG